ETPSLQGFVAWLESGRPEVKRDMDVARGEVRVMTIHGAKGLEAKVVILADSCTAPDARHHPRLFLVPDPKAPPGHASLLLWSPREASDPAAAAAARARIRAEDEAEHRRLLYVAMTRAEDRLIVAGHEGQKKRRPGNW